jgi:hypothetical protein
MKEDGQEMSETPAEVADSPLEWVYEQNTKAREARRAFQELVRIAEEGRTERTHLPDLHDLRLTPSCPSKACVYSR